MNEQQIKQLIAQYNQDPSRFSPEEAQQIQQAAQQLGMSAEEPSNGGFLGQLLYSGLDSALLGLLPNKEPVTESEAQGAGIGSALGSLLPFMLGANIASTAFKGIRAGIGDKITKEAVKGAFESKLGTKLGGWLANTGIGEKMVMNPEYYGQIVGGAVGGSLGNVFDTGPNIPGAVLGGFFPVIQKKFFNKGVKSAYDYKSKSELLKANPNATAEELAIADYNEGLGKVFGTKTKTSTKWKPGKVKLNDTDTDVEYKVEYFQGKNGLNKAAKTYRFDNPDGTKTYLKRYSTYKEGETNYFLNEDTGQLYLKEGTGAKTALKELDKTIATDKLKIGTLTTNDAKIAPGDIFTKDVNRNKLVINNKEYQTLTKNTDTGEFIIKPTDSNAITDLRKINIKSGTTSSIDDFKSLIEKNGNYQTIGNDKYKTIVEIDGDNVKVVNSAYKTKEYTKDGKKHGGNWKTIDGKSIDFGTSNKTSGSNTTANNSSAVVNESKKVIGQYYPHKGTGQIPKGIKGVDENGKIIFEDNVDILDRKTLEKIIKYDKEKNIWLMEELP